MPDLFSDFMATPSGDTFVPLRAAVTDAPEYDFHANDVEELDQLVNDEDYEEVSARMGALMPNWLLSPRVHRLLAYAAGQLGDTETAQREGYLARACLRGLLQSGDGTPERPYLVTHVADEYDVLDYLKKDPVEQRQVVGPGGAFDVLLCEDDSELWFDISPAFKEPA
jgi:hypothetical protein